eukprot:scaffold25832_cov60-Cyclotella_meneghiniana.AAC.7
MELQTARAGRQPSWVLKKSNKSKSKSGNGQRATRAMRSSMMSNAIIANLLLGGYYLSGFTDLNDN